MGEFKPTNSVIIKDFSGNPITVTSGVGLATVSTTPNVVSVFLQCGSGSGGVALTANTSSMPYGIIVKNVGHVMGISGLVHVGTSGSPPYISGGYILATSESVTLNASRPDFIRVYGTKSGIGVSWLGFTV